MRDAELLSGFGKEARLWRVAGRVQGVGYRAFVARAGRALGLHGGARNLDDGRVEVVAEGPSFALERLEAALLQGPRHARVDRVDGEPLPALGSVEEYDAEF